MVGGTGSGKTFAATALIREYLQLVPRSLALIVDTKPRFRAEWELNGMSARRRYRRWDHGEAFPDSVRLDLDLDDGGIRSAQQLGRRVFIVQSDRERDLAKINRVIARFFEQAQARKFPRLVYVDEMLDHFGENGYPKAGMGEHRDAIKRCATAGRELGISLLCAGQRPAGIPRPLIQEASRLYLFKLDSEEDVTLLYRRLGLPRQFAAPAEDREFLCYDRAARTGRYLTLRV